MNAIQDNLHQAYADQRALTDAITALQAKVQVHRELVRACCGFHVEPCNECFRHGRQIRELLDKIATKNKVLTTKKELIRALTKKLNGEQTSLRIL